MRVRVGALLGLADDELLPVGVGSQRGQLRQVQQLLVPADQHHLRIALVLALAFALALSGPHSKENGQAEILHTCIHTCIPGK